MNEKKMRYKLTFDKSFGYSCVYREGDREKIIKILKDKCLETLKESFYYLSKLPDDKLLELLNIEEYQDGYYES